VADGRSAPAAHGHTAEQAPGGDKIGPRRKRPLNSSPQGLSTPAAAPVAPAPQHPGAVGEAWPPHRQSNKTAPANGKWHGWVNTDSGFITSRGAASTARPSRANICGGGPVKAGIALPRKNLDARSPERTKTKGERENEKKFQFRSWMLALYSCGVSGSLCRNLRPQVQACRSGKIRSHLALGHKQRTKDQLYALPGNRGGIFRKRSCRRPLYAKKTDLVKKKDSRNDLDFILPWHSLGKRENFMFANPEEFLVLVGIC